MNIIKSLCLIALLNHSIIAQEPNNAASVNTSIGSDGTGTIVVEAHGQLPKPPVFFTATSNASAQVGAEFIEQTIEVAMKVVQGEAITLSLGLTGQDVVTEVQGNALKSWSVRQEGGIRFLDLSVNSGVADLNVVVRVRSRKLELKNPETIELSHLTPGTAVGFDSNVVLQYSPGVEGTVTEATGFAPLNEGLQTSGTKPTRFRTSTGGSLKLVVNRAGTTPGPVEMTEASLNGTVHANGNSILFQYRATAAVTVMPRKRRRSSRSKPSCARR